MVDSSYEFCESCGVKWDKHLGMIGTCKRVKKLEALLKVIRSQLSPSMVVVDEIIVQAIDKVLSE